MEVMAKVSVVLLRPIMGAKSRLKSATGKRFKRFILAAAVAVASSQITLTLCLGVFHVTAVRAGFIAWFAGATASYIMSRWAWERKGRPHLLKETLPFWIIAACVATVLTLTTKFANELAVSMGLSHAARVLFVDAAFFLANCVTFITRFFIFHYILFADKSQAQSNGPGEAPDHSHSFSHEKIS
jgi:putative flippase GtrA